MRRTADNVFAIQLENEPQNTVRAWVTRPHVDGHGIGTGVRIVLALYFDSSRKCGATLRHEVTVLHHLDSCSRTL